jgi:UDP-4-amino-4,6-dideoxy-N-acetyl-beta-L-altrosamine N-acetyltransferase
MYTDHLINWDEHQAWVKRATATTSMDYHIFEYENQPIGLVGFYDINYNHQRCSWAFYLGEENTPKGSGKAMEFFALQYIFDIKKIRKLCCEVFTFNENVIGLHKKFGFSEEALYKGHYIKEGVPQDVVALALFKDSWEEHKQRLKEWALPGK